MLNSEIESEVAKRPPSVPGRAEIKFEDIEDDDAHLTLRSEPIVDYEVLSSALWLALEKELPHQMVHVARLSFMDGLSDGCAGGKGETILQGGTRGTDGAQLHSNPIDLDVGRPRGEAGER